MASIIHRKLELTAAYRYYLYPCKQIRQLTPALSGPDVLRLNRGRLEVMPTGLHEALFITSIERNILEMVCMGFITTKLVLTIAPKMSIGILVSPIVMRV